LESPVRVQRAWRTKYKSKYAPNGFTITAIIKKFDKTGSVHNVIRKNKETSQQKEKCHIKAQDGHLRRPVTVDQIFITGC